MDAYAFTLSSRKRKYFQIWEDSCSARFDCYSDCHTPTTDCDDTCPALRTTIPKIASSHPSLPSTNSHASQCCKRCDRIDFLNIFSGPRRPGADHVEPTRIGFVAEILAASECPVCRLLVSSISGYRLDLQLVEGVVCSVIPWRADVLEGFQSSKDVENVATQLVVELTKEDHPILPVNGSIPNIALEGQAKGFRDKLGGLKVPPLIDFNRIKSWIGKCEARHHGSCGVKDNVTSPSFKECFSVIDVRAFEKDPAQMVKHVDHRRTRYVALSYVWNQGTSSDEWLSGLRDRNRQRRSRRQGSSTVSENKVSDTVRDAVEVCKKLGERYLWVDALCIVGSPKEKKFQIRHMDSIYSHAAFTIIAGQSRGSKAGLPGTTNPRSLELQTYGATMAAGVRLAPTKPSLSSLLGTSTWKTRGWTFQEGLLSRRCLIFTDQEVFFCCRRNLARESLKTTSSQFQFNSRGSLQLSSDFITSRDLGSKWDYITYTRLINEYTKRKLTYQSDKLSALQGITNLLSAQFGTPFLFGHPVRNLVTSLCWFSSKPMKRLGFPSWSWADCSGEIQQDFSLTQTPLEENKFAKLAAVHPIPASRQLLVNSSVARIALECHGGENITSLFPRGTKKLQNRYYPRPEGSSFFTISSLKQTEMEHFARQETCELLMLARLHDFNSRPSMSNARPELEYVIALLIERTGSTARRKELLAVPAHVWDESSPKREEVSLD